MYISKFLHSKAVAINTKTFYFEKPTGFVFKGGQTIDLTLMNPIETDEQGNTRTFSLASAPYESELMITTRLRDSAFKRSLNFLLPGMQVKFDGPFGSMTLHNDIHKPAVFLAGGIGATPFRSMILQAIHDQLAHRLFLFDFNRRPQDSPFLEEFKSLESPTFNFIPAMSQQTELLEWQGERGYVDEHLLRKYIGDLNVPIYYIAGTPRMVSTVFQLLVKIGVDSDNICTDDFSGY